MTYWTQNNAQQPYSTPSQPYEIPTSPYNGPGSSYRPPEPVVRDPLYGLVPAARAPPALTRREQPQSQQSNLLTHPPPTQHYTIQVTEPAPKPAPQKTQHETRSRGWFSGFFRRNRNDDGATHAHLGSSNQAYHDGERWIFPGAETHEAPVQAGPPPTTIVQPAQDQNIMRNRYVAYGGL